MKIPQNKWTLWFICLALSLVVNITVGTLSPGKSGAWAGSIAFVVFYVVALWLRQRNSSAQK